jgi:hypothetical protein
MRIANTKWGNVQNLAVPIILIKINPMTLSYSTSTIPGSLRTLHTIVIETEKLETTRAKEILLFAKPRIFDKETWKQLKECVKLGNSLEIRGGDLF